MSKAVIFKFVALGLSAVGTVISFISTVVGDKKDELLLDEKVHEKVGEELAKTFKKAES